MKKRKIVSKTKKGVLSEVEKKCIQDWVGTKDDVEIATELNRSLTIVQKYKNEFLGAPRIKLKRTEAEEIKRELRTSLEWKRLKEEFDEKELTYFENDYIEYRRQFKDLTPTEFKQLYQMIKIDIFMHRINKERKYSLELIDDLEVQLTQEKNKPPALKDRDVINELKTEISSNRGICVKLNDEYHVWMTKHNDLFKSMKSTRDQRIKDVEQSGKFMSVLKELEIEEKRNSMAEITGLMDLAVDQEKKRLAKPHQYGFFKEREIDQPLLNSDTVIDIEEETYGIQEVEDPEDEEVSDSGI